jgi:cytidylate kinase
VSPTLSKLPRTIALDGPAGSGKTSVAFVLSREMGYMFVDTGAFYRALTLAGLRTGIHSEDELVELAERAKIETTPDLDNDARLYTVRLDGDDVTWAIRGTEVEADVSRVAAISSVRAVLNQRFGEIAASVERVIMVGRDIGTVVLPDADLKIYLDASLDKRAERRSAQTAQVAQVADDPSAGNTKSAIADRDQLDSQRAVAPLRLAADAHYINTDNIDIPAVIEQVKSLIRDWQARHH